MSALRASARTPALQRWDALPRSAKRGVAVALLIVVVIVLPFFLGRRRRSSTTRRRRSPTSVMALGLNIVVGFAGLLDLGYVAFYAFGAYTIGWFGSGFFSSERRRRASTSASATFADTLPGHPPQLPLIVVVAAIVICASRAC